MDKQLLEQLAKRLNLTDYATEEQPYILTPDEENDVIEHALAEVKKHAAWKMTQILMTEQQIEIKLGEIDWNEKIDREDLLILANMQKHYQQWEKEQRRKEKEAELEKIEELKKRWTSKFVYGLMSASSEHVHGKKLIVNDNNKKLIKALCFLVSRDKRYETDLKYSFDKGLLIRGISGLGKTHLVRCVEKNEIRPIRILSMLEISDEVKHTGEYNINMGENKILYLDDVGSEETVINHFGTKIMFFKNYIETKYLNLNNFGNLIISTNLSFAQISEKYGFRVASRMREVFNVVDIVGTDMRGQ